MSGLRSTSQMDTANLSEDQLQLQEAIRRFAGDELAPFANKIDRDNDWSELREFWVKLGDMGLLGITAPEEYGGSALGYTEHVIAMEVEAAT